MWEVPSLLVENVTDVALSLKEVGHKLKEERGGKGMITFKKGKRMADRQERTEWWDHMCKGQEGVLMSGVAK